MNKNQLKAYIKRNEYTVEELAHEMGLTNVTIWNYLRDATKISRPTELAFVLLECEKNGLLPANFKKIKNKYRSK